MPSYKNLTMIAFAASSVSPVLSAPTRPKRTTEASGIREIAVLEGRTPGDDSGDGGDDAMGKTALAGVLFGLPGAAAYATYHHWKQNKEKENNQRDVSPQTVAVLNALAARSHDSDP